jgi:2-oxoglutarate ferredoxin oxidoreductase subunit beta
MGVFRAVSRPTYDELMAGQLETAAASGSGDEAALQKLLGGNDTWQVA